MKERGNFPRTVKIRFPDDEALESYVFDPAFLIHPHIAIGCKSESFEIYKLKQMEERIANVLGETVEYLFVVQSTKGES